MPKRLDRLQRQSQRAFRASAEPCRLVLGGSAANGKATPYAGKKSNDPSRPGRPALTASLGGGRACLERAITR